MNLKDHYRNLYKESIELIASGHYQQDLLIDSKQDHRFGLTLLIRPSEPVKQEIQSLITELNNIEPNQYYYPNSDIHMTVMSIISCSPGFNLDDIVVADYIDLIQTCVSTLPKMTIQCKGLTASPACIMIQGFNVDNGLNDIRNKLRLEFKKSHLRQTLDIRYAIQTAHSTIVRFRTELKDVDPFLRLIDFYQAYDFGTFEVEEMELVYNDWYQRKERVEKLHIFKMDQEE